MIKYDRRNDANLNFEFNLLSTSFEIRLTLNQMIFLKFMMNKPTFYKILYSLNTD